MDMHACRFTEDSEATFTRVLDASGEPGPLPPWPHGSQRSVIASPLLLGGVVEVSLPETAWDCPGLELAFRRNVPRLEEGLVGPPVEHPIPP